MQNTVRKLFVLLGLLNCLVPALSWDYEGHRLVNTLAINTLPTKFPEFVRTPEAKERIAFLSGEPDRWRNTHDLTVKHANGPDHFLDIEDLADYKIEVRSLPIFRHEFTAQLALGRPPQTNASGTSAKDLDKTKHLPGYLPWTIAEGYGKLKSAFSYLKALEAGGTPEEITNAQQNIIYLMGVMGHFVGDAAQPLHTTRHFNGWVGENPNGFTTNKNFHSWIDGGYLDRLKLRSRDLSSQLRLAKEFEWVDNASSSNVFPVVMSYIMKQHELVTPLYELEKAGKLPAKGPIEEEGKTFIAKQLLAGAQMLGDLWFTAWQTAPPDTFLQRQLSRRRSRD